MSDEPLRLCRNKNRVSMKSGLEGRNNPTRNTARGVGCTVVSMKSGLEGRNN